MTVALNGYRPGTLFWKQNVSAHLAACSEARVETAVRVIASEAKVFERVGAPSCKSGSHYFAVGLNGYGIRIVRWAEKVRDDLAGDSETFIKATVSVVASQFKVAVPAGSNHSTICL